MNFNTDGFNERSNYIHNSNDINRLKQNETVNYDSSFTQMKINENKPEVETTSNNQAIIVEDTKGNKENFVLMNNSMRTFGNKPNQNNPVASAMNRNGFKK